jgi:hypothetical protein
MKRLTLDEIIEGWPKEAGDTLDELTTLSTEAVKTALTGVDADLAELVWQLRSQAKELLQSTEREAPLGTPTATATALRGGMLKPKKNWWITYPLDSRHRRILAPHKSGGSRYEVLLRSKFPLVDELPEVEAAGGYLVIWGGPPDVLHIPGVSERIKAFPKGRLVDVIFWDADTRNVHSLRFGFGESNNARVDFEPALEESVQALKEAVWP